MTRLIDADALLKMLDLREGWQHTSALRNLITNAPAIEQDKQISSFAWALIMETAASFEVASYSISDEDAKKSAEGAIKYARDNANKYYTTPQQTQSVADALEEAAKLVEGITGYTQFQTEAHYQVTRSVSNKIRALIKRNAVKEGE